MKRRAYLSGQWYPKNAEACEQEILFYTRDVNANPESKRGIIAPHAGWRFSGACAGKAYKTLAASHAEAELVVIFGSHKGPNESHTVFLGETWETPFGDFSSARDLAIHFAEKEDLDEEPSAPRFADNAVEVQLPFMKYFFPQAKLLMVGASPKSDALELGEKIGAYAAERNIHTVFVGSTDLTHYGPNYRFAPKGTGNAAVDWVRQENDRKFINAVLEQEPEKALEHAIREQSACCPGAVGATMRAIKAYQGGIRPELQEHLLSYDILPSDSFVGYASILL